MRGCSTLSLTPARCTSPLTYRVRTCTHRLGPTGPPSSATNGTASTSAEAPSPQHAVVPARGLPGRDYGALDRTQYGLFVQFFRQASPYIEGHRGRTFVISIPGEVRECVEPSLHCSLCWCWKGEPVVFLLESSMRRWRTFF